MRAVLAIGLAVALSACSPGDTKKIDPHAVEGPKPLAAMNDTFGSHCTWGEVKGAKLSVWSYACAPEYGDIRLVPDDALPGFRFATSAAPGADMAAPIRIFTKAPEAPIDAILPAVRAASPGLATDTCAFAPATGIDNEGKQRVVFAPTGAAKVAWDASVASDAPQDQPCGPLGVGMAGDRTFEVMAGHPDTVVYVDHGSEIQIFDDSTIKLVEPAAH